MIFSFGPKSMINIANTYSYVYDRNAKLFSLKLIPAESNQETIMQNSFEFFFIL